MSRVAFVFCFFGVLVQSEMISRAANVELPGPKGNVR